MNNLEITNEMLKIINEKEGKVNKLNTLCKQLVALELREANKRVEILNRIEAEAEKKVTDKTKQATADAELKQELGQIAHLKNDISSLKREIELCNDKISLHRNIIREMELMNQ